MGWIGLWLVPHPAPGHDLRNPLRVAGIEIPPAFEDFEHIFLIGQPDQRGTLGADFGDVKRRVEGLLLCRRPFEIPANAIPAPGRGVGVVIIKRRAAIGEERGGHKGKCGAGRAGRPTKDFYRGIGRLDAQTYELQSTSQLSPPRESEIRIGKKGVPNVSISPR